MRLGLEIGRFEGQLGGKGRGSVCAPLEDGLSFYRGLGFGVLNAAGLDELHCVRVI